jgi:AcrR family transcriptional regulator
MKSTKQPSGSGRRPGRVRAAAGRAADAVARTRRTPDPVDSRRRILDAAEELIAENGFDATPTARIAKQAAVPKGLVFHYFPTKIDLLTALVSERTNAAALSEGELEVVDGDVAATLVRLAERVRLGEHASERMRRIVFREAETHPEVRAFVDGIFTEAVRLTRLALDLALSKQPEVDDARKNTVAEAFAALLLHESNMTPLTGAALDLEAIARIFADGIRAVVPQVGVAVGPAG